MCKDLKRMRKQLRKLTRGAETFQFYNFEVTSIQKAPKELLLSYKMQEYASVAETKKEEFGKKCQFIFCCVHVNLHTAFT